MNIDYTHSLTQEEARSRLEALGDYLSNRHGIRVTWAGEQASFNGKYLLLTIQGELTFAEGMVKFRGKDPGRLLRGKARNYLEGKLETYLDPKTPIEELPRA